MLYLFHGGEEALWVEKSSHPERIWTAIEAPAVELSVSLYKLGKPETQCTGVPRYLEWNNYFTLVSKISLNKH